MLTLKAAAKLLGIHRTTLKAWILAGTVTAFDTGKRLKISPAEVQRILATRG